MGNIRLYLRANERIFINGAVLKFDRRASIELLNDATFLLENHVMQREDANTPFKQLYFVIQLLFMDPTDTDEPKKLFKNMVYSLLEVLESPQLVQILKTADVEVATGKEFAALKTIRSGFELEESVLKEQDAQSEDGGFHKKYFESGTPEIQRAG